MMNKALRPRTKLFRALGLEDPPQTLQIAAESYELVKVFKHDSWAATALYEGAKGLVVCKFNRQQAIFGLPMRWLGKALAQRENRFLQLFAQVPHLPKFSGAVSVAGKILPHVSAHDYIEGVPLRQYSQKVKDDFFPKLQQILQIIHSQNISYMDLNKQENILVDLQGEPYLIDFQICFHLKNSWPGNSAPMRGLLKLLQESDRFHLMKHYVKLRPDLLTPEELQKAQQRPWFLKVYRCIQIPLRTARRKLLTLLGFRKSGKVTSEVFVEEGFRGKEE
ncbi:MAG: hypothetical protein EPN84_01695 [Legionella sp.]|nr:MAG: hypothetical protein EPN84_01695 [Legionella sp.]